MKVQWLGFFALCSVAACAGRPAPAPAPAAAPTAVVPPPALRYTPGQGRYRLESVTHIAQEAMGQTTAFDITTNALLSVALADSGTNLGVAITIDSLGITSSLGMGAPGEAQLAAARGKTVRMVVSRQGRQISMAPADSGNVVLLQVAQGLRDFLPVLPAQAPSPGATWSDTGDVTAPSQGVPVTVHMAREHRVNGWEDRPEGRALHLATTSTYTLSGSGETQGQTIQLSGGGRGTTDAFVSAAGVYLGGAATDSADVNATITSAGIVVPIHRTTRSTFTRLP